MNEQVPEATRVDWRCRVVATLAEDYRDPETGQLFPTGSVMTVDTVVKHGERELAFGDPSAVALFLNQSHNALMQAMRIHPFLDKQPPRSRLELDAHVYDYLELIMTSVLFAYTAIEAFSNEEIPDDYYLEQERNREGIFVAYGKESIERKVTLNEKLASVLPETTRRKSPKGLKVWEDYVTLRRLRDRIVHLKTPDRARSSANNLHPESLWKELLQPQQPDYPSISKNMILHFRPDRLKGCPF